MTEEIYKKQRRYRCDFCRKLIGKNKQVWSGIETPSNGAKPPQEHFCCKTHSVGQYMKKNQLELFPSIDQIAKGGCSVSHWQNIKIPF